MTSGCELGVVRRMGAKNPGPVTCLGRAARIYPKKANFSFFIRRRSPRSARAVTNRSLLLSYNVSQHTTVVPVPCLIVTHSQNPAHEGLRHRECFRDTEGLST